MSILLESDDPDSQPRHACVLEKIGEYISSVLPDNSKSVQPELLIRIGKGTNDNFEPQSYRFLELLLGS